MDMQKYIDIDREVVDFDTIEDNIVIYGTETDSFYELKSDVSKYFWSLIDGKRTLQDIHNKIIEEFEVSSEILQKDMDIFLSEFLLIKAFDFSDSPFP